MKTNDAPVFLKARIRDGFDLDVRDIVKAGTAADFDQRGMFKALLVQKRLRHVLSSAEFQHVTEIPAPILFVRRRSGEKLGVAKYAVSVVNMNWHECRRAGWGGTWGS
jgi:hypothetical protein